MVVVYSSLLTHGHKYTMHWYYLEDVGLLAGELCQLEAVLPLRLPGDHAPVQHQWVPQHGVAAALLLEQQQGRLPTASLPGEPGAGVSVTRHVMETRGQGVLTQGDQLSRDGRHLDGEQVPPVDRVHRLGEVEAGLEDEADILPGLLAPSQRLQHHLQGVGSDTNTLKPITFSLFEILRVNSKWSTKYILWNKSFKMIIYDP